MTLLRFLPLLAALLGLSFTHPGAVAQTVTKLTEDNEVILRVPVQPRPPEQAIVEWLERKGPNCIPMRGIRRALLSGPDQVDFVLVNRMRVRAQFEGRCPALDFYGGFYLRTEDQRLCAGRDAVHSRMGGDCTIQRFKHLVPKVNR